MKYILYSLCISFVLIGACKSKEQVSVSRSAGVNTSRSGIKNGIEGEEKAKEENVNEEKAKEKKEEKKED